MVRINLLHSRVYVPLLIQRLRAHRGRFGTTAYLPPTPSTPPTPAPLKPVARVRKKTGLGLGWWLVCTVAAAVLVIPASYFLSDITQEGWQKAGWFLFYLIIAAIIIFLVVKAVRGKRWKLLGWAAAILVIAIFLPGIVGWFNPQSDAEETNAGQSGVTTPKTVEIRTIVIDREWSEWIAVPDGYHLAFDRTELVAYEMETPSLKEPVLFPRDLVGRVAMKEDIEMVRFRVTDEDVPVVAVILRFWPIGTPHPDKPVIPPAPKPKTPAAPKPPVTPKTIPATKSAPTLKVEALLHFCNI